MTQPAPSRRGPFRSPLLQGALVATVVAVSIAGNTYFRSPPRFDGAGYAVLALALERGEGYREIDHPDRPPHDHYPPGYSLALAALWRMYGPSVLAAHWLSAACTVTACLAAWAWFRTLYSPGKALALALALALNWMWGRAGGAIQTEPLFFLLSQLALLLALWVGAHGGITRGAVLGIVLGACILTRHVGICLAVAVGVDVHLRKRATSALAAAVAALLLVGPWVAWLARVHHNTQVALLLRGGLGERLITNGLLYVRRLPDALSGPFVEVATVFGRSWLLGAVGTAWGAAATALIVLGWLSCLRAQRRRLAGLAPLFTLPLLLVWPFTEAGRFLVPLVPFLLVGAVEGAGRLAAGLRLRKPRWWAIGALVAAAIPYSAYSIASDRAGAAERSQAGFDAACAWIAQNASQPGPILTRQPGEVFLRTGRTALAPPSGEPEAIEQVIIRYGVAYLLVDEERYARAPVNPLTHFAETHPDRVERVWSEPAPAGGASYTVFAVRRVGAAQ